MEANYKDSRDYLRSLTTEKYMNTDAVDVEDRAAGTRMCAVSAAFSPPLAPCQ